jgi:GT2 family glycosyltransferase
MVPVHDEGAAAEFWRDKRCALHDSTGLWLAQEPRPKYPGGGSSLEAPHPLDAHPLNLKPTGWALSDCQPPEAERGDFSPPLAEARRQITLLRAEIRCLSRQLKRQANELHQQSAELQAAVTRNLELEAAFAIAMAERTKILQSRAWRLTRAVQQAAGFSASTMSRLLRSVAKERLPTPGLPAPETAPPLLEQAAVSEDETTYEIWARSYDSLSDDDRHQIRTRIEGLVQRPVISIVLAEGAPEARRQTVLSLDTQLYSGYELCTADGANATGTFLAFMEPGDRLPEHALFEVAATLDTYPDADVIYSDEDVVDDGGLRHDPVFKPAFSIELLLGANMIGRLAVYRRSLLATLGVSLRREREHDLAIRAAIATTPARIRHIPAILYHRLVPSTDPDPTVRPHHSEPPRRPVADVPGMPQVLRAPIAGHPEWRRVIWPLPDPAPRVSLIVATRDKADLLARCVVGLLYRTDYPDLEVLVMDNDSREAGTRSLFEMLRKDHRARVIPAPGAFNFSALNNIGVRAATGEVVVLVNNDIDVIDSGWLREMVSHAIRPDVGAVGAKLIYGDDRIQHAGIVLGVGHHDEGPGIAGHFGHFAEADDAGYLGQFALTREVSAVTGACLALRREVWEAVGGLDEINLPVAYNDVDLCLRIRARGYRIIWTPFAELYHLESASRGREETPEQRARAEREARYMRDRWGSILDDDPFYNPNFDRSSHLFTWARPPRLRSWRHESVAAADAPS